MKSFSLILAFSTLLILKGNAQEVKWYSIEEAVELNKQEPRKFVIDVYTDWCGWCKVMEKNTFNNEIIAKYLNEKYYPVKLNAEQKADIDFLGTSYKYIAQGNRGYHELAAAFLGGQMSYPSVVFLDEKIQGLHIEKGYIKAKQFDMIIKFIGEDLYKTTKWDTWSASYNSPVTSE
ncbi:MAG: DUF255 domain-containing protein [Bacteroidales bacterium]|nr:DUF255 domain-containing protein [Bacteroidales bacterium]MBN2821142.1 DUF255 domain-containing protein [Bacteroidales bacterium]